MTTKTETSDPTLVFFDENCTLCTRAVKFVQNRSEKGIFKFIDLNGASEKETNIPSGAPLPLDRLSVWQNNELLSGPEAVFEIIKNLRFPWNMLYILRFLPKKWSSRLYFFVAAHRHQWKIRN